MRVLMFYHSALSDWNHGNAHFLRGIATELQARGHDVVIYEPRDSWSFENLLGEEGPLALRRFNNAYPHLHVVRYSLSSLHIPAALEDADLVLVHEWNSALLVAAIGQYRRDHQHLRLYFHDTHHRSVTAPHSMAGYDLRFYDAALVYGASIAEVYRSRRWCRNVCVWHEAADTRVFRPRETAAGEWDGDVVWIGNWGDEERAAEIREFLIGPVRKLGLRARVYGVRYPAYARDELAAAGIDYAGWIPNFDVPKVFARFKLTVHIPRQPYRQDLPGIPTIRPFEAMACGIPLVSAPWEDCEGLFQVNRDYLIARDGAEMSATLEHLLSSDAERARLAGNGRDTVLRRHTCTHRVDQLLSLDSALDVARTGAAA